MYSVVGVTRVAQNTVNPRHAKQVSFLQSKNSLLEKKTQETFSITHKLASATEDFLAVNQTVNERETWDAKRE